VREALRLLESQGNVFSTLYRGMRLMQVTNRGVAELMRVRTTLEAFAIREIVAAGPLTEAKLGPARPRSGAPCERAATALSARTESV